MPIEQKLLSIRQVNRILGVNLWRNSKPSDWLKALGEAHKATTLPDGVSALLLKDSIRNRLDNAMERDNI